MTETHTERMTRLDTYRREGRILRNAWTAEDHGRHLACLLAAYSPEVGAAESASACPADALPGWVAHLTVWMDDCGSEAAWGPRIDRWIEFLRRAGDMDTETLRRLDYRVRAVCLRFCLPRAGTSVGVVQAVLGLCDAAGRGEPVTGEQWAAAEAAEAAAEAAAGGGEGGGVGGGEGGGVGGGEGGGGRSRVADSRLRGGRLMARKKLPASERLKAFRKARELSQAQLGKRLSVKAPRVCEWEGAVCKPDASHRIAIAEFTKLFGDEIRVEDW